MIITCPECATRYDAATEAFEPDGRKVKCTCCSHTWHQQPERAVPLRPDTEEVMAAIGEDVMRDDVADLDDEMQDDYAGMDDITDIETEAARLAGASRRASAGFAATKASRTRALRGWLALAACVTLFIGGGYFYRTTAVEMFPAAAQLYSRLGLEVNIRGLEFRNLTYAHEFESGVPVMAIRGEIVNISGENMTLPRVRFSLLNDAEQEIYHWTVKMDKKPLQPSASLPFSTRLASPPPTARNIQVRFASISR